MIIFLVLFAFLVNAALRRDPFESLLFSIALAVGMTPEFLPMILTVTLGQGARRNIYDRIASRQRALESVRFPGGRHARHMSHSV